MLLGGFDGELAMLLGWDAQRELARIGATGQRGGRFFAALGHVL